MPKLPVNFVKAPSFDNPLRSTAGQERTLALRLDDATWEALMAACEREGSAPEALILRALERFLNEPRVAMAPRDVEVPRPSLRAQLFDQLHEQFVQRSWVKCLLTLRAIVREVRADRQPQPT
jgi:hypothetical protein